jgi:CRISPR-associated endoribonuclease Cas6
LTTRENGDLVWVINTLNADAHQQIAEVLLLESFSKFRLRAINADVEILQKCITKFPRSSLSTIFYDEQPSSRISCRFITSTSFKQGGKYQILPDVKLLLQSLMFKYSQICESNEFADEELLLELMNRTEIVSHNIMSSYFKVGQAKIPGFLGRLSLSVSHSRTLSNYTRMLLKFGEFSGCGIKTAMGMGAMRFETAESRKGRLDG